VSLERVGGGGGWYCDRIKVQVSMCAYKMAAGTWSSIMASGIPRNFVRGGGSTNSVEDRENGDLGAVAPLSGILEAAVIWYKKFHMVKFS
jgi:hypothetical protein